MSYRVHQGKNLLAAICEDGMTLTFTPDQLSKVRTDRIPQYIDAEVRKARAEQKLAEIGFVSRKNN